MTLACHPIRRKLQLILFLEVQKIRVAGDGGVPIVSEVLTSHSASKSEDSVEISFPTNGSAISFDLSADLPPSEILLSYDKNTLVEIIKSLHAELHIERKRVAKFSSRSIDNQWTSFNRNHCKNSAVSLWWQTENGIPFCKFQKLLLCRWLIFKCGAVVRTQNSCFVTIPIWVKNYHA